MEFVAYSTAGDVIPWKASVWRPSDSYKMICAGCRPSRLSPALDGFYRRFPSATPTIGKAYSHFWPHARRHEKRHTVRDGECDRHSMAEGADGARF